MVKYQAETTGVAPITALLLAAMMVASLLAMNMTAERALNPGFASNTLTLLTGGGLSRGVSLRGVGRTPVENLAQGELAAVRRAIRSAVAGAAQPALAAAESVAKDALSFSAAPAAQPASAKKTAKPAKDKKGSAVYAEQVSTGPRGKTTGKTHGKG